MDDAGGDFDDGDDDDDDEEEEEGGTSGRTFRALERAMIRRRVEWANALGEVRVASPASALGRRTRHTKLPCRSVVR